MFLIILHNFTYLLHTFAYFWRIQLKIHDKTALFQNETFAANRRLTCNLGKMSWSDSLMHWSRSGPLIAHGLISATESKINQWNWTENVAHKLYSKSASLITWSLCNRLATFYCRTTHQTQNTNKRNGGEHFKWKSISIGRLQSVRGALFNLPVAQTNNPLIKHELNLNGGSQDEKFDWPNITRTHRWI